MVARPSYSLQPLGLHILCLFLSYYPHMPIGKVWIYRLLFVCFLCACVTVMDFSTKDKNSGVKFCTAVHWRPRQGLQGVTHFGELCSPRRPKSAGKSASARTEL